MDHDPDWIERAKDADNCQNCSLHILSIHL
jgi:hypothetical protein